MGGHSSRIWTAVLLGFRERRYFANVEGQQRDGFYIEGHTLSELVNWVKFVDDASPVSLVLCDSCVHEGMVISWGRGIEVTIEEVAASENKRTICFLNTKQIWGSTLEMLYRPLQNLKGVETGSILPPVRPPPKPQQHTVVALGPFFFLTPAKIIRN